MQGQSSLLACTKNEFVLRYKEMSMNEQQRRLAAAQSAAATATTPEQKSRADAAIVGIMSEKPKQRSR